jgi:hypothetical protein
MVQAELLSAHGVSGVARSAKSSVISFSEKPSCCACLMNWTRRTVSGGYSR